MMTTWRRSATGDWLNGAWRVRGPILGRRAFWLYRSGLRYTPTGRSEDALSFETVAAAKAFVAARCPDCGHALDVQHDVVVDEPYFPLYPLRDAPLPRRTRVAKTVAFCNGCEFCEER